MNEGALQVTVVQPYCWNWGSNFLFLCVPIASTCLMRKPQKCVVRAYNRWSQL